MKRTLCRDDLITCQLLRNISPCLQRIYFIVLFNRLFRVHSPVLARPRQIFHMFRKTHLTHYLLLLCRQTGGHSPRPCLPCRFGYPHKWPIEILQGLSNKTPFHTTRDNRQSGAFNYGSRNRAWQPR